MDQEFRIPTKSQERVQNRDIIHDCISNFAGHNCGQELKYSCSCKVGFNKKKNKNKKNSSKLLTDFPSRKSVKMMIAAALYTP